MCFSQHGLVQLLIPAEHKKERMETVSMKEMRGDDDENNMFNINPPEGDGL